MQLEPGTEWRYGGAEALSGTSIVPCMGRLGVFSAILEPLSTCFGRYGTLLSTHQIPLQIRECKALTAPEGGVRWGP